MKKAQFSMLPILQVQDMAQLALVEALFMANDIHYFVHNRYFGSLYPCVQIDFYNNITVMVYHSQLELANELLLEYQLTTEQIQQPVCQISASNKLAMAVESLLMGWFVPRK